MGAKDKGPSQDFIICMQVTQEDLDMFARINTIMQNELNRQDGNVSLAMKYILWYKDFIYEVGSI